MPNYRPNVALLLLDKKDRLLVCERLNDDGAWQFPQGGVGSKEHLEEALVREVEEEIGLPPESYEILDARGWYKYLFPSGVKKGKKRQWDGQKQTYYLCRLVPGAPPVEVDDHEFQDHKWIRPKNFVIDWIPEFKREVYRAVMKDFFGVKL